MSTRLATSSKETIPVIESKPLRKGPRVVVGVIDAGTLIAQHCVPHRNTRTKKGYQRELSKSRVNRLEKELLYNHVDLPTAVLLSMRDGKQDSLISREKGLHLKLENHHLNVVDGQHRVESLRRLVKEDPGKWSDFRIPFVCVIGANELQEMEQFYVVNSTAKSVRTDLAYDLLKQRAENDPEVVTILEERGETWKITGQTIVERLAAESILWRDRIRFSGEPKATTTINNSGMVNSLKQLLSSPYFVALTTDNQFKILEAYWQGIRAVLPDCFAAPTNHAIQKSTGVMILHTLLLSVIEHVRSSGDSVIESSSYESVLEEPLLELQEDNSEGGFVRVPNSGWSVPPARRGRSAAMRGAASFWLRYVVCCQR